MSHGMPNLKTCFEATNTRLVDADADINMAIDEMEFYADAKRETMTRRELLGIGESCKNVERVESNHTLNSGEHHVKDVVWHFYILLRKMRRRKACGAYGKWLSHSAPASPLNN